MDASSRTNSQAFSIIEVLLSLALISILSSALLGALTYADGLRISMVSDIRRTEALEECFLVTRFFRDRGVLSESMPESQGIRFADGEWQFSDIEERGTSITVINARDGMLELQCDVGDGVRGNMVLAL